MKASSAVLAMDVTEASMLAALEAVRSGDVITAVHKEAILIGLTRAAARWATMTAPAEMDGGFEAAFALCLQQERRQRHQDSAGGTA